MKNLLRKILATESGRKKIAESMVSPIRCGGLDYIDGKPFYKAGGKLYSPKEWETRLKSRGASR